jgi:hypothetical protein
LVLLFRRFALSKGSHLDKDLVICRNQHHCVSASPHRI